MGSKPSQQPTQIINQTGGPAPAPPVKNTNTQVIEAGMDLRRREMMKKNIKSTIYAGDTGGFSPYKTSKALPPI